MTRIHNHQRESKERHPAIAIVSLDIEGAFDNVDQDGIIIKLWKELWPNPIRHWLANYILNRRITIKYGSKRGPTREVCKGVPQGSPLGPILWNYVINKLDDKLNDQETEILAYADDLVIAHTSANMGKLQKVIDTLNNRLGEIKLQIKAEKSSIMHIQTKALYQQRFPTIYINQKPIPKVRTMNILGVRINDQLKLDTDNQETRDKIKQATHKLSTINRLNIIYKPLHWRVLIEAHLTSIIQQNNTALMAIDNKAHEWTDKTMAKAIKTIFNWPQNASNKLTRLITGTNQSKLIALSSYKTKLYTEHHESYQTLINIAQPREAQNTELQEEDSTALLRGYDIYRHRTRNYYNPDQTIKIERIGNIEEIPIVWLILERGEMATAIQLISQPLECIRKMQMRNATYPISYFNTLTLLWHMSNDHSITDRSIVFSNQNSLLMALKNETGNHDWRVIKLRERLATNKWTICEIDKEELDRTKVRIIWQTNCQEQPAQSELQTTEPDLRDLQHRNKERKIIRQLTLECTKMDHTTITKTICPNIRVWKRLSPKWVSSKTILMLTGTSSIKGKLQNGKMNGGEIPEDCRAGGECRYTPNDNQPTTHVTLHRATNCVRYACIRTQLCELLNLDTNQTNPELIIKEIQSQMTLCNKAQSILRLLTEAALTE